MATKQQRITAKLAHVESQIAALRDNGKVVANIGGGPVPATKDGVIALHERCRDELAWAQGKTDAEIRTGIAVIERTLRPEVLARKYGDLRGFTTEAVEAIRKIELLEVALGTHPGLDGRKKVV